MIFIRCVLNCHCYLVVLKDTIGINLIDYSDIKECAALKKTCLSP